MAKDWPMTEEVHTARSPRAGVPPVLRGMRPGQLVAAGAWFVAIAGFVVFLGSVSSFVEAYGGVVTGIVLLLWMTLFSVFYYATPDLRRRSTSNVVQAHRIPVETPHEQPSALADRVNRVVEPSAALRNPVAQGHMMSVLGARAAGISERETDLMDWGFAFGVAWAVVQSQDPAAPEEVLSERALNATQAVYEAYRGSVAPPLEPIPARPSNGTTNGTRDASATHAHTDRS
jgi:hypothetical protein